jgi:hypothetical protein
MSIGCARSSPSILDGLPKVEGTGGDVQVSNDLAGC